MVRDMFALGILLASHAMPSPPPVSNPDLLLDDVAQIPEVPIVIAPHVVRQLVAQRPPDRRIVAVAVVGIGAQPQLNHLPAVAIQAQRARLVRRMHGRVHLGEQAHAELVLAHRRLDARVIAEALEEAEAALGLGEIGQRSEGVEGVRGFFLDLAAVHAAARFGGVFGVDCAPVFRGGCDFLAGGGDGAGFGGGGTHECYLFAFKSRDREVSIWKWRTKET